MNQPCSDKVETLEKFFNLKKTEACYRFHYFDMEFCNLHFKHKVASVFPSVGQPL